MRGVTAKHGPPETSGVKTASSVGSRCLWVHRWGRPLVGCGLGSLSRGWNWDLELPGHRARPVASGPLHRVSQGCRCPSGHARPLPTAPGKENLPSPSRWRRSKYLRMEVCCKGTRECHCPDGRGRSPRRAEGEIPDGFCPGHPLGPCSRCEYRSVVRARVRVCVHARAHHVLFG